MTREEYLQFMQRYKLLNDHPTDCEMANMVLLQDVALRAFVQSENHEAFWEEETASRILRQKTFRAMAAHGK